MEEKIIRYKHPNGEITVLWRPKKCIHSAVCINTLPRVYDPGDRPWVKPEHASTQELIKQIDRCPSGALQYELHGG
ncbi:hypothetical protein SMI01S_36870 [Sphingobacterium mizutaii NBRC 14946 = DSM 11724]|uniref:Uncharacterized conserved protein n=3 Tax=Sphingobacterium mizutaii TaxID=1010 RepID=A0AAJ5BZ04_9SPHI|nr:hypothetical protein SMI01S_36870 [Sphingobacterium mizutaii NBRC 14946 = DSM 11724]SDL90995.1 Uncharacterized Fe-S cluster protein YjdI [Sphingobacterium mizutaii]SNV41118.1 Uncharacterized conserved protein [Sphingobacterium mizutaii]